MNKFKVGDRVRIVREFNNRLIESSLAGRLGTLVAISPGSSYPYNVRYAPDKTEWVREIEHVRLVKHPVIVITTDGKTTTATKRLGKEVLGTATARCNPGDKFDFDTGATLAFARLVGAEVKFKEDEKPWPKKLVCVEANAYPEDFCVGRTYNVEHLGGNHGLLRLKNGSSWGLRRHSDTEFRINMFPDYARFIPLVED